MTSNSHGERVLIVEDEPSTRLGLTELVRTWGFTTEAAADGEEALQRITAFRPSIIISDMVMPRMGGLDLLRALKDDGGEYTVVILTAQGSSNWILNNARVETITNDRWKGLSSAGVTWKFDAEAATANDNSPTLTQPEVVTYRADGFIPYSIEVGQDWPGFAEEMSRMLGSGYRELLAEKLATGSAANTPRGLVSRLVLQTSPDVSTATTTAGTIAGADIYAMWARLPERHRDSASWLSSTSVQNAIRQLGTVDPNFTVNITDDAIARMFGRQYGLTDYMDSAASGTAAANQLIVGDMKGYLVAQRAGMSIEFVPMLFDVTNNRPTGQRGWFAYARVGADVVNPTAFQLLQNKTS